MDFEKKLKKRLYFAIAYTVIGILLIIVSCFINTDYAYVSSFGAALTLIGIVRIRNYFIITKDAESIRKRRVTENDERNISIMLKAKNIAFGTYILTACVLVIVLEILKIREIAMVIEGSVCFLVFVYWLSYWILRKKS